MLTEVKDVGSRVGATTSQHFFFVVSPHLFQMSSLQDG